MLKRSIRKWDLVLLMINGIIGAGIFGLPSKIFKLSGVYSLLALFICSFIVILIILCFAEVSSRFDKTGGPYVYALEAFGSFPGFIMGWLLELTRIITYAALINLLVTYLSWFSPMFHNEWLRITTMLTVTALLAWVNHIGIKNSTNLNNILAVSKLLPLTAFIVIGLFSINPGAFETSSAPAFSDFSTTVLILIFAFGGFESVIVSAGEIREPKKNVPFALISAAIIISVFYCLIQLVSIGTFPGLASSEKPLADAANLFMGPYGGTLIAMGAIISIMGTLNAVMLIGSRLPYALSIEGQLPKKLSYVHPRYHTPTVSLLLYSVITVIISITGSFVYALTISAITRVLIYLIVCAAMIRLRKNNVGEKYFKIPAGKVIAVVAILFSVWLLTSSKVAEIRDVGISIAVGGLVYWLYKKFKQDI